MEINAGKQAEILEIVLPQGFLNKPHENDFQLITVPLGH